MSDLAVIGGALFVLGAAGALLGESAREGVKGGSASPQHLRPLRFWTSMASVTAGSIALLSMLSVQNLVSPNAGQFLIALREDQMNAGDVDWQRRGYYEELDVVRAHYNVWRGAPQSRPPGWTDERLFHRRDDFLRRDMAPSESAILSGTPATTNRWGMRDRDYELKKPQDTYRIVLVGSSHEVGSGVKDDETFENLVEDRLNAEKSTTTGVRYEILNLSVGGYGVLRRLARLEQEGFRFTPDAVIFGLCAGDRMFDLDDMSRALQVNLKVPFEFLDDVFKQVKVDGRMDDLVIQSRLQPHVSGVLQLAFRRLLHQSSQRGIRVFAIYRPDPAQIETARRDELIGLASQSGLEVFDLSSAFDEVHDRNSLVLAAWDKHTNASGHRLLADELFRKLAPRLSSPRQIDGDE